MGSTIAISIEINRGEIVVSTNASEHGALTIQEEVYRTWDLGAKPHDLVMIILRQRQMKPCNRRCD